MIGVGRGEERREGEEREEDRKGKGEVAISNLNALGTSVVKPVNWQFFCSTYFIANTYIQFRYKPGNKTI